MSTLSPPRWLAALAAVSWVLWPAPSNADPPSTDGSSARSIRRLMASFDHEPSVRAVQRAALRHTDLGRNDDANWDSRARLSNLFPEVEGELAWLGEREANLNYTEEVQRQESGTLHRDNAEHELTDDSHLERAYSLNATVDLGGLVFDRDELSVSREQRQRESARRKLLARVTNLYFERRKKQILRLANPPGGWQARLDLILEIERLTARIDGLTGGWFRQKLSDDPQRQGGPRD